MEQTAERSVGLQPLVAQLSEAINAAHMRPQSRQTQGMQVLLSDCVQLVHTSPCCIVCLL